MRVVKYPSKENYAELAKRPVMDLSEIREKVKPILQKVNQEGDEAVKYYTRTFDGVDLESLAVPDAQKTEAIKQISVSLKEAIDIAFQNIEKFHHAQIDPGIEVETMPGVVCRRKSRPIGSVGLYVPGGTAPLFSSVLMLGVPAMLAGCKNIVLCTPPDKSGRIHPAMVYAASICNITQIFRIGGAQAIAAMAYGTRTVPKVYKIFGPGNQYVTAAKQMVSMEGVAIDMPAGPSELAVFADETARPEFVAADLLSQAEHGIDSQVILVTTDETLMDKVKEAIQLQLEQLPRKEIAARALENSSIVLVNNEQEAVDLLNYYAAEHLIIASDHADKVADGIENAGSVFLGHYTPESAGDYASGTNHTLPTNQSALAYSGVSLDSFVKKITYQEISPEGLKNVGPAVEEMAASEQLQAHKNAVSIRLKSLI
ncbi:MAG: histidinol dehydrogenase [Cyclobacteriaceae bacterium]|nr:histidinol dehydrogenase [Cyclobacteriaceae bacterium]